MNPESIFQIPVNQRVLVKLIWPEIAKDIIIGKRVPKSPRLPDIYRSNKGIRSFLRVCQKRSLPHVD
jgi:hypothetical protein